MLVNALFSTITSVICYQKGKLILDYATFQMLCQMSKQTKRHKYPELFKFDEMTDVLDDFDSV